jgi:hypothetical protein
LFRYGDVPCRLEHDDREVLTVRQLNPDRLLYEVARVAQWFRRDIKGNQNPASPPMRVIKDMLAVPNLPLPVLSRITEVPVFAPDGTLQTESGYHPAAQTYCSPPEGFSVPKVPKKPTPEEIRQAKDLIFGELLEEFPFVGQADRAHATALLLLPYARDLIKGPTPNHLVESPAPGSGKSLLVDVCLRAAFGPHLGFIPQANDDAEWRKRITAALREGRGAIVIDNLSNHLDSGVVAGALTVENWSDRILGRSEMVNLPVRCIWVATGNNPSVSTEILRRSIRIRIDPSCERPWERKDFKHSNLRVWADENRADLVWAALTLIKAWVVAGQPLWDSKTLGSYEHWAAVMGGILETNEIEGFLGNLDEFYETSDAEGTSWGSFVEKWRERYGEKVMGVGDLFDLAVKAGLELKGWDDHAQRVSLGMQLRQHRDQIIGGYRIVSAGKIQGAARWKLIEVVQSAHFAKGGETHESNESIATL